MDKVSDEINLKARKVPNKFNNSLIDLEIIIDEVEKINNNERLEIKKTKVMIRTVLDKFKIEKTEELGWKLNFLTVKCRFF